LDGQLRPFAPPPFWTSYSLDGTTFLNGSYNWTRTAASNNDENLVRTHDTNLVGKFAAQFEKLWSRFA